VRQLVEVAEQALHAGIDQLFGDAVALGARAVGVDQAGDFVEGAGLLGAEEGGPHRLARRAEGEDRLDQAEGDEFFAGDDDVGPDARAGGGVNRVGVVEEERLVHRVRPAGDDQRADRGIDPPGVADHL
jgi:hypothetical protein